MLARRLIPSNRNALRRSFSQVLAEPATWNSPAAAVTQLPNGVKVVTRETFGETASLGVFVEGGSRAETQGTIGASFALQELVRSGTKKSPALISSVENLGALLTVEAGRDNIQYKMSLRKGDLKAGVDMLADLATTPNVGEFEKLKPSIAAKLENLELPSKDVLMDRLHLTAFRDSNLGYSQINPEGVNALTGAGLAKYVQDTVTSDKVVLVADGAVKHAEIVKLAEGALGTLKPGSPTIFGEKPYFCGAELIYRNDEMGPTAFLCVGYESVGWRSPEFVTFMLMAQIVGSYKKDVGLVPGTISANRTTNNIANQMGVGCAEEYEAFFQPYKDTGLFGFYAACDEVAVEHCLVELFLGVNFLSFSVTDEEVEKAKRELKTKYFAQLDNSMAMVGKMGEQVMGFNRVLPPAEFALRLDAIDAEEVKRVAFAHLHDSEVAVTALGPLHGMPDYYEMRRCTYMHRY